LTDFLYFILYIYTLFYIYIYIYIYIYNNSKYHNWCIVYFFVFGVALVMTKKGSKQVANNNVSRLITIECFLDLNLGKLFSTQLPRASYLKLS